MILFRRNAPRHVPHVAMVVAMFAITPCIVAAQQLPDARAVLARYAKATNAAKLATFPGYTVKGTFDMPASGLKGSVEGYTDQIGRSVQIITLAGIGEVREGVDTAFAWSLDPMQGPKLIEGKEFIESRERDDPRAMQRDPALVTEAVTLERTTADGQPCVKLKLKWKSGRSTTECYSEATGLLITLETTQTSSMGELTVMTTYGEYKVFEGVTLPTKNVQKAAGTEVTIRFTDVTVGRIDPARFAIPPEIAALRKK